MQSSIFISEYRTGVVALLDALDTLASLRRQYDALDLRNGLVSKDFSTGHEDITRAEFVAAVGSAEAFSLLLAQGHGTNLYKLKH